MDDKKATFSEALEGIKKGVRVTRRGWNGKGMWVALVHPGGLDRVVTVPFLLMVTATGNTTPWTPSQEDMLSDDWCAV